jgi:hypothetical protein
MPRETQAVFAGHLDVEQRNVDRMPGGYLPCGRRAIGRYCRISMGDEVLMQHLANVRLVIDD